MAGAFAPGEYVVYPKHGVGQVTELAAILRDAFVVVAGPGVACLAFGPFVDVEEPDEQEDIGDLVGADLEHAAVVFGGELAVHGFSRTVEGPSFGGRMGLSKCAARRATS